MYSYTLVCVLGGILRRLTKFPSLTPRSVNMMRYYTHGYVTLHGKRDFADVIKVTTQLTKLNQRVIIQVGLE